jgi:hypothetical protein
VSKLDKDAQDILITLHDRISTYNTEWWSFASAFEAAETGNYEEKRERVFGLLLRRGLIRADSNFEVELRKTATRTSAVSDTGVTVTDLGRAEAVKIMMAREPKSLLERLHLMNWATWGGLAAVLAAIASTVGAIFAFRAIP